MTHYLLLEISKPGHIRETWRTDTIQQMVRVADAIEAGDEEAAQAMTDVAPHEEPLGEMFRGPVPL